MINIREWIMEIPKISVAPWFFFLLLFVFLFAQQMLYSLLCVCMCHHRLIADYKCGHARRITYERVKENIHHMLDHDAAWWWIKQQCMVPCQCFFSLLFLTSINCHCHCKANIFFMPIRCVVLVRLLLCMSMSLRMYRWFLRSDECWHKVSFVIAISYIVFLKIDIGKLSVRLRWSVCFEFSFASTVRLYYHANTLLKCRL